MSIYKEFDKFVEANFNGSEIKHIQVAYELAQRCHEDQVDKNCNDYIEHCLQVALNTGSHSYIVVCTALLHDVIEDYYMAKFPTNYVEVAVELAEEVFDTLGIHSEVYSAVLCLTKYRMESYAEYIQKIKSSRIATEVKLADLKHNMDITRLPKLEEKDIERLKKYHAAYIELKG